MMFLDRVILIDLVLIKRAYRIMNFEFCLFFCSLVLFVDTMSLTRLDSISYIVDVERARKARFDWNNFDSFTNIAISAVLTNDEICMNQERETFLLNTMSVDSIFMNKTLNWR